MRCLTRSWWSSKLRGKVRLRCPFKALADLSGLGVQVPTQGFTRIPPRGGSCGLAAPHVGKLVKIGFLIAGLVESAPLGVLSLLQSYVLIWACLYYKMTLRHVGQMTSKWFGESCACACCQDCWTREYTLLCTLIMVFRSEPFWIWDINMPWSNGFNLGSNSLVSFACSGHVHPNGGIEPFWFWHRALERASQFGLKQGAWITRLQMLQFCVGIPFAAAVLPKIFAALLEMAGSFLLLRFSNLVKKN